MLIKKIDKIIFSYPGSVVVDAPLASQFSFFY
jgi:hypothetical protein